MSGNHQRHPRLLLDSEGSDIWLPSIRCASCAADKQATNFMRPVSAADACFAVQEQESFYRAPKSCFLRSTSWDFGQPVGSALRWHLQATLGTHTVGISRGSSWILGQWLDCMARCREYYNHDLPDTSRYKANWTETMNPKVHHKPRDHSACSRFGLAPRAVGVNEGVKPGDGRNKVEIETHHPENKTHGTHFDKKLNICFLFWISEQYIFFNIVSVLLRRRAHWRVWVPVLLPASQKECKSNRSKNAPFNVPQEVE